jgi:hypothetical protein
MTPASIGIGILLALAAAASAEAETRPIVVVELFTSQGCSSCPPADAFLGELAGRPDVLALSEHVDYWDYLGWPDPFGLPENSRRQRAYAQHLGLSYVYTPQVVVQGRWHAAGGDRSGILRLIAEAETQPEVQVTVDPTGDGAWIARLAPATLAQHVDIWLVQFDRRHSTHVGRGENGGRHVENHNVVRGFTRVAEWRGEPASLPFALGKGERCAVLVQQADGGRILGAAQCDEPQHE